MRRWHTYVLVFFCMMMLAACSVQKADTKKIRDIEFTVVDRDDIPEELMTQIKEGQSEPFKLTYADKEYLYIARGYGTKNTTGYSVKVQKCYETSNSIYIKTDILGPSKDEEILKKETFPYVVVKTEYSEKSVTFD